MTVGSPYLRIVVFQVVEVCLGSEEELHDCRGIRHELDKRAKFGREICAGSTAVSIVNATDGGGVGGSGGGCYLLLAYGQANQTDALDGLAAQQPQLLLHGVLHDVFQRRHELVVVRHELLLRRVGHGGDGRHHLLQDKLGALLEQLSRGKKKRAHALENGGRCCGKSGSVRSNATRTSCSFASMMMRRCSNKLSKYGTSRDLGQSSVKLIRAAAACACTRGLLWSFIVSSRVEIT